jgi:hypothetical protein
MFTNNKGDRTEAQNYLVLLTDGKSDKKKAINQAALCNSRNVRIISVGIGSGIDVDLLTTVAYEPDYYINTEYNVLNTTLPTLVSTAVECSQGKNTALYKLVTTVYESCHFLEHLAIYVSPLLLNGVFSWFFFLLLCLF